MKKDLIEKYKFYCKHLLSFNKDYVNKHVGSNYYEECEDYLKELENWLNNYNKDKNKIDMSNLNMRNMRLGNI